MKVLRWLERLFRSLGGKIRGVGYTLKDLANEVNPDRTPEEQFKIWREFLDEQHARENKEKN